MTKGVMIINGVEFNDVEFTCETEWALDSTPSFIRRTTDNVFVPGKASFQLDVKNCEIYPDAISRVFQHARRVELHSRNRKARRKWLLGARGRQLRAKRSRCSIIRISKIIKNAYCHRIRRKFNSQSRIDRLIRITARDAQTNIVKHIDQLIYQGGTRERKL